MEMRVVDKVVSLMEQTPGVTPEVILEVLASMAAWLGDMTANLGDDEFDELIEKALGNIEQEARDYREQGRA